MIDASSPLTVVNRTILKQLCSISFNNHSHLYIALNKVDLVNPEIASPSILQRDFGVDLEDEDPTAEEHGKADVGSAAMGERRALHDQRVAEGWHR